TGPTPSLADPNRTKSDAKRLTLRGRIRLGASSAEPPAGRPRPMLPSPSAGRRDPDRPGRPRRAQPALPARTPLLAPRAAAILRRRAEAERRPARQGQRRPGQDGPPTLPAAPGR